MMALGAVGGTDGKNACARTLPGPSKGNPSPWSSGTKRMMISGPADSATRVKRSGVYPAHIENACSTASAISASESSGVKFWNA